jgi:hypothetical protein
MFVRDATAATGVAQRGTSTVAQRARARGVHLAESRLGARFMLVALVGLATGCRQGGPSLADAGQESDASTMCVGVSVCDGTSVRACRMGRSAEVTEDCAAGLGACSLGRCVSSACAAAEQKLTPTLGCAFYTLDLDNVSSDDPIPTSVLVTNPGQLPAQVALERRVGGTWMASMTLTAPPMQSVRFQLPDNHHEGGGFGARSAFRITTDLPVSAAHVESDDSTPGGSRSSGGTQLLAAHMLGQVYRAVSYAQVSTPELVETDGSLGGAGQLVIIGTSDGTHVTITPSATANLGPGGGVPMPGSDGKVRLTLDDGDVFTLLSNRDGADLSGTSVSGDRPLSVFSGNISTTYGITATGVSSPDLAHEQLLPTTGWDTSFVAAQLTPQSKVCDPLLTPPGSSIWTIVADKDATQVHFSGAAGMAAAPDRVIDAGEAFHVSAPGDFVVTSSAPIQVMQGMDCEPTLSSAVPTTTLFTEHWFGVLPGLDTMIAVVRRVGEPVYLDGALISDKKAPGDLSPGPVFAPAGGGFEVARVSLEACPTSEGVCTHHLVGVGFGFTMRGMDVLASYALTAPTWPCSDPTVMGCVK